MFERSKLCWLLAALCLPACGSDEPGGEAGVDAGHGLGAQSGSGSGGTAAGAAVAAGSGGSGGRRSALWCAPQSNVAVQCGGQTCPTTAEFEHDPCFVPCCVMFEGQERCGFKGTSPAFSTACVLPAVADPSCDEIPQFQGCCEPTRHVCGIIGGFSPGCTTKSNFVTLPQSPKACGQSDADAGAFDMDAGG